MLVNVLRIQESYALQVRVAMRRIHQKAQAVRIARVFSAIIRHYRESAAVKLQCWYRSNSGYSLLDILRRERWASRKIRHFLMVAMKRRHAAARKIAIKWWRMKPGRFLRHLTVMAKQLRTQQLALL